MFFCRPTSSSQIAARLITYFIELFYADVKVVMIHSEGPGIFRYGAFVAIHVLSLMGLNSDDNIRFINQRLRPAIEAQRSELAQQVSSVALSGCYSRFMVFQFGSDWRPRFRLMTCVTTGAPARMLSIHNCLRKYQPHTLHVSTIVAFFWLQWCLFDGQVWQLKSFWSDFPANRFLRDSDVEFQRFRSTELSPPTPIDQITEPLVLQLVPFLFVRIVLSHMHLNARFKRCVQSKVALMLPF